MNRSRIGGLLVVLAALACAVRGAPCAAQSTNPAAHGAPRTAHCERSEPDDYRFAPGDVLEVTVAPQHTFDRTVTVQPDGRISFPIVGQVPAGGLTVAELTDKLQEGLNGDLVDPRVTISLKELNKHAVPRVSVLGQVKNEGVIEIKAGTTLAEALAVAGGPTPLADLRRVTITRVATSDGATEGDGGTGRRGDLGDGATGRNDSSPLPVAPSPKSPRLPVASSPRAPVVITVDLAQTEKTGRLDGNVALQAGDIIVVPEGAPPTVLVLGEVLKPGSVDLHGEARLLDALSGAGGPTPKADLRRITLARPGVPGTRTLDLQPLLTGGNATDPSLNVTLLPGDTILVRETDQQVYVLGRVAKPDLYALKPNERVLDLLAKSGGATADGDISKAVLIRRDAKGEPRSKLLDLKKMMAKGNMAENARLLPGDVLFIPDKKTPTSPTEIAGLIWPVTGLFNLLRHP